MHPPSPPSWPLLGHIPAFRRDVLGLLLRSVREHGDILRFRLGPRPVYLVNDPGAVHHVLRTHARNYDKETRTSAFLRDITGESLLTSNGEAWTRRRHLFQPAFHRQATDGFAAIMREEAAALADRWRPGTVVDAATDMMGVTFRIVARTLFGSRLPDDLVASLEQPIGIVLAESFARHGKLISLPSRRFRQAMTRLDAAIARVLDKARPEDGRPDLLTLMRSAGFSADEIRNESITFLLAGHETTANALTWLLAFLARHPDDQQRCAQDAGALDRALSETLRLAPPVWIIERRAIETDEIAGFTIPAGSSVVVCPFTIHRHPRFWRQPDEFLPDRFLEDPPAAYLPFGLGPRFCIGREFALMEARLIAGILLDHFRVTSVTGAFPVPEPSITLRVRGGLGIRLHPRS